jgi:lipid-binding SYLF domain-containing protein
MKQAIRSAAWGALFLTAVISPQIARAQDLRAEADQTISNFKAKDPTLQKFFDTSVGYAVFPTVAKGGLIVGAAHGDGLVYEHGKAIGRASLTQGSIGAQIGGLTFSQVIFFQTAGALEDFKSGRFVMSADVSAVVATQGSGTVAPYREGVAVFTLPKGGMMAQATVGGQKFGFEPLP